MIVYIYALLTVALPAAGVALVLSSRAQDRREWFLNAAVGFGLVVFSVLAGGWAILGFHLRLVPVVFFAAGVFLSFKKSVPGKGGNARLDGRTASMIVLMVLLTALNLDLTRNTGEALDSCDTDFPLKKGRYLVYQGGASRIANPFHALEPSSRYALDIVKLDERGKRANGMLPSNPADYWIFGEPLYSPMEGVVLDARDGMRDNSPPAADKSLGPGNHLLLRAGECVLLFAHLARGSVKVGKGDIVKKGQLLGRVGNSGNSIEPHLHIQAMRPDENEMRGAPVVIAFGGRVYSINDEIIAE